MGLRSPGTGFMVPSQAISFIKSMITVKQSLSGSFDGNVGDQNAEKNVDSGVLAMGFRRGMRVLLRSECEETQFMFWKRLYLAAFCSFPGNESETEFKTMVLICMAEEISG